MPAHCRFKADRENDFVVVLPIAFIVNFTTFVQPKSAIRACTDFVYCPRHSLYIIRARKGGLEIRLAIRAVQQQRLQYIRAYTNAKWANITANPQKKDCRLPHSEVGDNALCMFFLLMRLFKR